MQKKLLGRVISRVGDVNWSPFSYNLSSMVYDDNLMVIDEILPKCASESLKFTSQESSPVRDNAEGI